jgi:hypothetical protein
MLVNPAHMVSILIANFAEPDGKGELIGEADREIHKYSKDLKGCVNTAVDGIQSVVFTYVMDLGSTDYCILQYEENSCAGHPSKIDPWDSRKNSTAGKSCLLPQIAPF